MSHPAAELPAQFSLEVGQRVDLETLGASSAATFHSTTWKSTDTFA